MEGNKILVEYAYRNGYIKALKQISEETLRLLKEKDPDKTNISYSLAMLDISNCITKKLHEVADEGKKLPK
jgi:hypothetical protein